jgi:hypothetical protein
MIDLELTLPAQRVNHTISSHIPNQSSSTPPTVACGNSQIPNKSGMSSNTVRGVIYTNHRTKKLDWCTFLKNLAIFVDGFAGGWYIFVFSCMGVVSISKSSWGSGWFRDLDLIIDLDLPIVLSWFDLSAFETTRSARNISKSSSSRRDCSR